MKVCELIDYLKLCNKDAEVEVCYTMDNPLNDPNMIDNILQINDLGNNKSTVIIQIQ